MQGDGMKHKMLVLLAVTLCTAGASQIYGQFGFGSIKRPNIANIFHPVVGAGTVYEETGNDGKKSTMEMTIVGSEMVGAQQGFWMEVGHGNTSEKQLTYGKMLVTPADFAFHKMVFVMPGSTQPMEMDLDGSKSRENSLGKDLEKWHSVGSETITVPAGTFSCEHWSKDDGKGDVWVSSKISPMGMVKMVDKDQTMALTKVITGAKSHITGTPVKFDPRTFSQNGPKP
jgi:hypothetical protein